MSKKKFSLLIPVLLMMVKPTFSDFTIKKIEIDAKGEGFFRNVTDMIVSGDLLYLADFTSNRVFCYQFAGAGLEFKKFIGRQGQGPGDIQKPLALSAHGNRIAIKDQESVSIFSVDGTFLNKFRQFSTFISFSLGPDSVFYVASNPIDRYLVSSYSHEGRWLSNILEKKLWEITGEISPLESFKELLIYSGQLWLDPSLTRLDAKKPHNH